MRPKYWVPVLLITLVLSWQGTAIGQASPLESDNHGYDISWPQCGGKYPDSPFGFAIIGVNDGSAFTRNPCFASEVEWARAGTAQKPGLYINTDGPAPGYVHPTCDPADEDCNSYRFGRESALYALEAARDSASDLTDYWLDVEFGNDWSDDLRQNGLVLGGMVDTLRAAGKHVGIYSNRYQYSRIAGSTVFPGIPLWIPAVMGDTSNLLTDCSSAPTFAGGYVAMLQTTNTYDENIICPGTMSAVTRAGLAATGAATQLELPFLANNHVGIYQSRFSVTNIGNGTACLVIEYGHTTGQYVSDAGHGGEGCGAGYPLKSRQQLTFGSASLANNPGTVLYPAATTGLVMSATVTSQGSPISARAEIYRLRGWGYDVTSYDAVSTATGSGVSKTLTVPFAVKVDGYYSQIVLSNPGNALANARVVYTSQDGQQYTVERQVPANGTASHSVYDGDGDIPEGFVGSATVISSEPVAAVVFRLRMTAPSSFVDGNVYAAVPAVPIERASTVVEVPEVSRRLYADQASCAADKTQCGYNSWVNVVVADNSEANVTLKTQTEGTHPASGCTAGPQSFSETKVVRGSFLFYQNEDKDNGLDANPPCFEGRMEISSDRPIVAVGAVTAALPSENERLYSGIPADATAAERR